MVNSLNCTVEFAEQEFLYIQRKYHKENDDRVAYHVIQSFDIRDDITPEQANEIDRVQAMYRKNQCVMLL
ncbi:relaxase/mobilization nuclease domain-containing protein [Amedibacillus dolichus]|mgnify:CR=1 FL=1|uniref:relaxase/mobilization nuclease domain-containing protein n=1 Tax=Amedibacillus dolichus TaxID=31971 RepID=UPI0029427AFB|nr:relaxase/mobilization nuclease domain-containing protein [Amedibacillus dolichus]